MASSLNEEPDGSRVRKNCGVIEVKSIKALIKPTTGLSFLLSSLADLLKKGLIQPWAGAVHHFPFTHTLIRCG
jgi:hypothetical protein